MDNFVFDLKAHGDDQLRRGLEIAFEGHASSAAYRIYDDPPTLVLFWSPRVGNGHTLLVPGMSHDTLFSVVRDWIRSVPVESYADHPGDIDGSATADGFWLRSQHPEDEFDPYTVVAVSPIWSHWHK